MLKIIEAHFEFNFLNYTSRRRWLATLRITIELNSAHSDVLEGDWCVGYLKRLLKGKQISNSYHRLDPKHMCYDTFRRKIGYLNTITKGPNSMLKRMKFYSEMD